MISLDSLALCENEWAGHKRAETDVWQHATLTGNQRESNFSESMQFSPSNHQYSNKK